MFSLREFLVALLVSSGPSFAERWTVGRLISCHHPPCHPLRILSSHHYLPLSHRHLSKNSKRTSNLIRRLRPFVLQTAVVALRIFLEGCLRVRRRSSTL